MIKLIAADMDGTLLNNRSEMTEKNVAAIKEFQRRGGIFVINTGRDYSMASDVVKPTGIVCDYICMSGAGMFTCDGKQLKEVAMPYEVVQRLSDVFQANGFYVDMLTGRGAATPNTKERAMDHFRNEMRESIRILGKSFGSEEDMEQRFAGIVENLSYEVTAEDLMSQNVPIYKVSTMSTNFEKLRMVKEELKTWPELSVASSFMTNIEVNSCKADKGVALLEYAASKGIAPEEVMAIGDSENDYAMLSKNFGCTVAMEESPEDLKAICTHTTLSNEKDGVAYAIERWAN